MTSHIVLDATDLKCAIGDMLDWIEDEDEEFDMEVKEAGKDSCELVTARKAKGTLHLKASEIDPSCSDDKLQYVFLTQVVVQSVKFTVWRRSRLV
ncbi:hypothetical protein K493DRAFT_318208 [Basidiobolus meristosporus CBS 931.73]|uniref:Uncharacterized protein n=1 Tax=Basidiobolus meristosporus CBS 931.73 TaxID=1314790 RepID=A0A1Y1XXK3_9FUNG|nr:hypothetical protein K493DRAFT_318208 [Basidiobolus meristosporus CBS 931.73]|eukprot:ORX90084.1 hypothetical protein K493DRAFT_318208 [Basidiobolus meristosporus CBS 931.73]